LNSQIGTNEDLDSLARFGNNLPLDVD